MEMVNINIVQSVQWIDLIENISHTMEFGPIITATNPTSNANILNTERSSNLSSGRIYGWTPNSAFYDSSVSP